MKYNATHSIIYATGADSKIAAIQLVTDDSDSQWVMTQAERGQSHDIHALELIGEDLLISGGLTTDICLYKLRNGIFSDSQEIGKKFRHILGLPQVLSFISISEKGSLVLLKMSNSLQLWEYDALTFKFSFKVEVKLELGIFAAAISSSGEQLAYSNELCTEVFAISSSKSLQRLARLQPAMVLTFQKRQQSCLVFVNKDN